MCCQQRAFNLISIAQIPSRELRSDDLRNEASGGNYDTFGDRDREGDRVKPPDSSACMETHPSGDIYSHATWQILQAPPYWRQPIKWTATAIAKRTNLTTNEKNVEHINPGIKSQSQFERPCPESQLQVSLPCIASPTPSAKLKQLSSVS